MLNANRGLYAEEMVNRTCDYYRSQRVALIEKREVPIKILKKINENTVVGRLMCKSFVDYFGNYQGKHFEFEVKQTNEKNFSTDMIQSHQFEYLKEVSQYGTWSFLIVYFNLYDEFYLIEFGWIQQKLQMQKSRTIKYEEIKCECRKVAIVYPGILNLINSN